MVKYGWNYLSVKTLSTVCEETTVLKLCHQYIVS